jgi:hypothetical protein
MPGILRVDQANVDFIYAKTTGGTVYVPGHIIQVVNTYYKTPTSFSVPTSSSTYTDVPGIVATITPKSTSSKIYMTVRWFGEFTPQTMAYEVMFNIKRNTSLIGQPDAHGTVPIGIHSAAISYWANDGDSTPETCFFDYYDSPASTSSLTYQVCVTASTGGTMFINRCVNASSSGGYERGTSSITLFEIAG